MSYQANHSDFSSDNALHQECIQLRQYVAQLEQQLVLMQIVEQQLRQEIDNACRSNERSFRHLLEALPKIAVQGYNQHRQVIFWNQASENLYGYTREEALGKPIESLILPPEITDWAISVIEAWLASGTAIPAGELDLITKDGSRVTVFSSHLILINVTGEPEMYCVDIDLSDRKRAEISLQNLNQELESRVEERTRKLQDAQIHIIQTEKMSSLGQLVAGIAHEINNPVSFIYGNLHHLNTYIQDIVEFLKLYQKIAPNSDPQLQKKLTEIDLDFLITDLPNLLSSMQIGTERIQNIVLSLRNFSRLDEAKIKTIDLHQGIENTLIILQHRFAPKSIYLKDRLYHFPEITINKNYGKIPLFKCHPDQLNQVFMSLLMNATDAVEAAFIQGKTTNPSIYIQTEVDISGIIKISIADNGIGVPESICHKIFDPFFTTKPVGKGTGMGLAISHQVITQQHGGKLIYQPRNQGGSEFIIQFFV